MDVFMRNKALYMEIEQHEHDSLFSSEISKNMTINHLIRIRKNIDAAVATKNLLAHTLLVKFPKHKLIPQEKLFTVCQMFSVEYKRLCGTKLSDFDIFLRHFPFTFKVRKPVVGLRTIDRQVLLNRYHAIIRRPRHFFQAGELPAQFNPSFKVTLIQNKWDGEAILKNMMENHSRVAMDLEGFNLGMHGFITLCQLAVSSDRVYLFDILKTPDFLARGRLKEILESTKIQKVLHGIAGDAANLYRQFNITIRNVYDTQAAFRGLQAKYKELRMTYKDENFVDGDWKISLNELMALYKFDTNQIKGVVKTLYKNNPNFWSFRPLCPALMHYAGEDVNMLLHLQDAINNHPVFKANLEDTIYYTDKVIDQQIKAASVLRPWTRPNCPKAKSIIRGTKSYRHSTSEKRRLRRDLTNGSTMAAYTTQSDVIYQCSDNAPCIADNPCCPYFSGMPLKYTCLLVLGVTVFFFSFFKLLKLWKNKKVANKKRTEFHDVLYRESLELRRRFDTQ